MIKCPSAKVGPCLSTCLTLLLSRIGDSNSEGPVYYVARISMVEARFITGHFFLASGLLGNMSLIFGVGCPLRAWFIVNVKSTFTAVPILLSLSLFKLFSLNY